MKTALNIALTALRNLQAQHAAIVGHLPPEDVQACVALAAVASAIELVEWRLRREVKGRAPRLSPAQVGWVRAQHAAGVRFKSIQKTVPMSNTTLQKVVKKVGCYASI